MEQNIFDDPRGGATEQFVTPQRGVPAVRRGRPPLSRDATGATRSKRAKSSAAASASAAGTGRKARSNVGRARSVPYDISQNRSNSSAVRSNGAHGPNNEIHNQPNGFLWARTWRAGSKKRTGQWQRRLHLPQSQRHLHHQSECRGGGQTCHGGGQSGRGGGPSGRGGGQSGRGGGQSGRGGGAGGVMLQCGQGGGQGGNTQRGGGKHFPKSRVQSGQTSPPFTHEGPDIVPVRLICPTFYMEDKEDLENQYQIRPGTDEVAETGLKNGTSFVVKQIHLDKVANVLATLHGSWYKGGVVSASEYVDEYPYRLPKVVVYTDKRDLHM